MSNPVVAAVVCDDPQRAAGLVAAGYDVVLIVGPEQPVPPVMAGGGRLAVLAGRPGAPGVQAAAEAMAAELFGPRSAPGGPA
jgi:hypothetical protein